MFLWLSYEATIHTVRCAVWYLTRGDCCVNAYRHAGDLGDILYALPIIKCDGGGDLLIESASYTRQRLTPEKFAPLTPLLMEQPYIYGVDEFKDQPVKRNLNDFRAPMFDALRKRSLGANFVPLYGWMSHTHKIPLGAWHNSWIKVEPLKVASVVINRSIRYHNRRFPWSELVDMYRSDILFLGLPEEASQFPNVSYAKTDDLLQAARIIAGSELFIGNQSCLYAIAEAIKVNSILEVYPQMPNCMFRREGLKHFLHDADKDSVLEPQPCR